MSGFNAKANRGTSAWFSKEVKGKGPSTYPPRYIFRTAKDVLQHSRSGWSLQHLVHNYTSTTFLVQVEFSRPCQGKPKFKAEIPPIYEGNCLPESVKVQSSSEKRTK